MAGVMGVMVVGKILANRKTGQLKVVQEVLADLTSLNKFVFGPWFVIGVMLMTVAREGLGVAVIGRRLQ